MKGRIRSKDMPERGLECTIARAVGGSLAHIIDEICSDILSRVRG